MLPLTLFRGNIPSHPSQAGVKLHKGDVGMASTEIPDIVVGRLPVYLRALSVMAGVGQEITSSHELGEKLGISSAQIRKDLSHFGEFGKQGTGYRISYLQEQLRRILKVDREWPVALIGIGDVGQALIHYGGFRDRGFRIAAAFDADPAKVGQPIGELTIQDIATLPDVVREQNLQIAMIATPARAAQEVADLCVQGGVRAILNYAPINLAVPGAV